MRNTTATVQCQSCFKHVPEAMVFCECGYCLGPNEDVINKIKAIFKTLLAPYYLHTSTEHTTRQNHQQMARTIIGHSTGRHERCQEAWLFFSFGQMTHTMTTPHHTTPHHTTTPHGHHTTLHTIWTITTPHAHFAHHTFSPHHTHTTPHHHHDHSGTPRSSSRLNGKARRLQGKPQRCCTVFEKNKAHQLICSSQRIKEQGKEMSLN